MKKYQELKQLIADNEKDADAFFSRGNKAAGTRLRNALQQAKVLATDIRKEVMAIKNKA